MIQTEKYYHQCVDCRTEYPGGEVIYLCPACEATNKPGVPPRGILKTLYQYDQIRSHRNKDDLFQKLSAEQFLSVLPLKSMSSWPWLRVGGTPLYEVNNQPGLYLKDDSQNPTFSFKDRASALVSAWAKEHGITNLLAASTGNAGSSLAGICASQGQRATIVVPAKAPLAKLSQVMMYGARLVPVLGTYDDAFELSVRMTKKYGWYNRNTAFNPLTIEGKKTVSFEIIQQLQGRVPDRIFIPVGDGVIFSGVCKGFEDMLKIGIIDRMPVLVAVQAEGSSNLIANLNKDDFSARSSKTIADSISVDVPQCFHMTAGYLRTYGGEVVAVTDQEIVEASRQLSGTTGIFAEPAASAAYAGMMDYQRRNLLINGSVNVVLLTGSGLKDLNAVQSSFRIPDPVKPELSAIENILK